MKPSSLVLRNATNVDCPRWPETLRDGSKVLIRPISRADKEAERAFIEGLSPESRRYRFMGTIGKPSDELLKRLTDIDHVHDVAFAAVLVGTPQERIVGVSRYSTDADGQHCECAVTVSDDWQNKGLGTVLMRHLIDVARARGIRSMYSIDSAENSKMRDLAKFLGFESRFDSDDASLIIHEVDLSASARRSA